MTINKSGGLYFASTMVNGHVYMGYSTCRKEAIEFCCDLIKEGLSEL